MNNNIIATNANDSPSPPQAVRPYTSYNLFFQLEREYILQSVHGYRPTILPRDKFDPSDRGNYSGPPLPSRYADLILPYDWHIPGKTRRRKRSHRKSHGKIGFHELNDQISKAWSAVDDETRGFCDALSEIEGRKYKKIKKQNKKTAEKKKGKSAKKAKPTIMKTLTEVPTNGAFDWSVPQDGFSPASLANLTISGNTKRYVRSSSSNIIGRTVSRESFQDVFLRSNSHGSNSNAAVPSLRDSINSTLTEVDMEDDEIMELWDSIPLEDNGKKNNSANEPAGASSASSEANDPSVCQVCIELPSEPPGGSTPTLRDESSNLLSSKLREEALAWRKQEEALSRGERRGSSLRHGDEVVDDGRRSFIDEEYERFREIGKVFRTERRMKRQNSDGGIGNSGVGGGGAGGIPASALMMKPFMARGA